MRTTDFNDLTWEAKLCIDETVKALRNNGINGGQKRQIIRTAVSDLLTVHLRIHASPDNVETLLQNIYRDSPLIGDEPDQVSPRPTMSGLRDHLSKRALATYALSPTPKALQQMLSAIVAPKNHGIEGQFGAHQSWTDDVYDALVKQRSDDVVGFDGKLKGYDDGPEPEPKTPEPDTPQPDSDELVDLQVGPELVPAIDLLLKQGGVQSSIMDILREMSAATTTIESLQAALNQASMAPTECVASGDYPKGTATLTDLSAALPECAKLGHVIDHQVPLFEWESPHPLVPTMDESYLFQPKSVMQLLYGLTHGERVYIHGHTGTGKTTLVEQVAARLQWPVMRINLDSEITRMDLIGRDMLITIEGETISQFVDGALPQALSQPCIMLLDEYDFVRPDVSYVLQRALEGNGLTLLEDGGRVVKPHPWSRIVATANTRGQGDELGMYLGARQQSMANLDRFGVWLEVDYLGNDELRTWLGERLPSLDMGANTIQNFMQYFLEHKEAFLSQQVSLPITPRMILNMMSLHLKMGKFAKVLGEGEANKMVVSTCVLNRANTEDGAVLEGIARRCFAQWSGN